MVFPGKTMPKVPFFNDLGHCPTILEYTLVLVLCSDLVARFWLFFVFLVFLWILITIFGKGNIKITNLNVVVCKNGRNVQSLN